MNTRAITGVVIVATIFGLIGWDVYAALQTGPATISEVVRDVSHGHPIVAFATGVLCGHLFWQQGPPAV